MKLSQISRSWPFSTALIACATTSMLILSGDCAGQMINTSAPFSSTSSSFYEFHGFNFGFSFPGGRGPGSRVVGYNSIGQVTPNISFNSGSSFGAQPAFGGFNPATATTFGFGTRGRNGGGFNLGLVLAKGSERQSITTAPSLTTMNGHGGSFQSGSVRPFVTSVVPILGHNGAPTLPMATEVPGYQNGVTRALSSGQLTLGGPQAEEKPTFEKPANFSNPGSSATTGAKSVSQIKAERKQKIQAQQQVVESLIEEAAQLESEGEFSRARMKYREAIGKTKDDSTKARIKSLIKASRKKG